MESHWRSQARPIIAAVLKQAQADSSSEREIRAALRNAYPFGPREYHPYKIWLDEIARQRRRGKYNPLLPRRRAKSDTLREQADLFGGEP